jgi:predicted nucleotidyltransferase
MNEKEICESNIIYKTYAGSLIYGTNHADSDVDIRGISIMPQKYHYGMFHFDQYQDLENDVTFYELTKFINLAMGCNPNIIELLFVADNHILFMNEFGKRIRDNRSMFLSKKLYHTFGGYAYAQWKKIMTKNPIGDRREIIEKYGWDVKFGLHLIRLLYEGIELLTDGYLTLPGFYNKELLDIRLGKTKYEDVLKRFEDLKQQFEYAYINSKLQHHADINLINEFLIEMLEDYWNRR